MVRKIITAILKGLVLTVVGLFYFEVPTASFILERGTPKMQGGITMIVIGSLKETMSLLFLESKTMVVQAALHRRFS